MLRKSTPREIVQWVDVESFQPFRSFFRGTVEGKKYTKMKTRVRASSLWNFYKKPCLFFVEMTAASLDRWLIYFFLLQDCCACRTSTRACTRPSAASSSRSSAASATSTRPLNSCARWKPSTGRTGVSSFFLISPVDPLWTPCGPPVDPIWTPVDPLWTPCEPPWTPCGPLWTLRGPLWTPYGPSWTPMDPLCGTPWCPIPAWKNKHVTCLHSTKINVECSVAFTLEDNGIVEDFVSFFNELDGSRTVRVLGLRVKARKSVSILLFRVQGDWI